MTAKGFLAILFSLMSTGAWAVECRTIDHAQNRYAICEADVATSDLRLFLRNDAGTVLGQFSAVDEVLRTSGERLVFAMNAGMYHADRSPVGYYVENGTEVMRIIPTAGPGNFGLLPNGIFCIQSDRADVVETLRFADQPFECKFATQSGPMLVIDGRLHPRFLPDSTSRYIRNGVGTSPDGRKVVFAISRNPVTFHEFGSFFKDSLGLTNALYLDGNISRIYAPGEGWNDPGFMLGPIVGIVEQVSD